MNTTNYQFHIYAVSSILVPLKCKVS